MIKPVSYGTRVYLLVLLGLGVGLAVVGLGYWRRGLVLVGLTMLGAAFFRLVLPERHQGALSVRARWFDVLWTGGLAVGLIGLALVVPPSYFSL